MGLNESGWTIEGPKALSEAREVRRAGAPRRLVRGGVNKINYVFCVFGTLKGNFSLKNASKCS